MKTGFDTTDSILHKAKAIKDAGYSFVIKYGANSSTFPNKRFTHEEIAELKSVGLSCGFVWEIGNTIDYFTPQQAAQDATHFIAYLKLLGVPGDLTICGYFAVDLDVDLAQIRTDILPYFKAVWEMMKDAGYLTGVYGSGLVGQTLQSTGYAHYIWKSNADKWAGFDFAGWDLLQKTDSAAGFNSELNTAKTGAGLWTPK